MNLDAIAVTHRVLLTDGCDGVGKSTLAAHLAARHGFAVVHSPQTPGSVDLVRRYRQLLASPGRLVLDRCFVSELVYGPLYRGHSRLSWEQAQCLAEQLAGSDGAFVHMTAWPDVIRARLLSRDGTAPPLAALSVLVSAYQRAFDALCPYAPVVTVDTSAGPLTPTG
ncbi:hypothetical protein ACFYZ9_38525 [Streptomyces sp. NPDC001691]|uniref:hypothetical protein n=1 Tax=Streptomyces sp. NPDC001691 TaxID=3364600 RepID=UPI00369D7985